MTIITRMGFCVFDTHTHDSFRYITLMHARVLAHIDSARQDGAKVLHGGERVRIGGKPGDSNFGGYFVAPTLVECAREERIRIAREEVFGPVMTLMAYDTEVCVCV